MSRIKASSFQKINDQNLALQKEVTEIIYHCVRQKFMKQAII